MGTWCPNPPFSPRFAPRTLLRGHLGSQLGQFQLGIERPVAVREGVGVFAPPTCRVVPKDFNTATGISFRLDPRDQVVVEAQGFALGLLDLIAGNIQRDPLPRPPILRQKNGKVVLGREAEQHEGRLRIEGALALVHPRLDQVVCDLDQVTLVAGTNRQLVVAAKVGANVATALENGQQGIEVFQVPGG